MTKYLFQTFLFMIYFNFTNARRDLNYKYRNECKKNLCLGPDTLNLLKYVDLDHIIPLSKGGSNEKDNLMYIPKYLNKVFSNNDYSYLKNYLFNLEGTWDQNDEGRFLNKNHEVYKMNEYFYKSKDQLTSKDRKNILNYLNDILKTKKVKIINNGFGEYLIPIITNRYSKTAIIVSSAAFICYTFIDKNNNGCLDEIQKNANLFYDYTKTEGNKYKKIFSKNTDSFFEYTRKNGKKYINLFLKNTDNFYNYAKKKSNEYTDVFLENINSYFDYPKKEDKTDSCYYYTKKKKSKNAEAYFEHKD